MRRIGNIVNSAPETNMMMGGDFPTNGMAGENMANPLLLHSYPASCTIPSEYYRNISTADTLCGTGMSTMAYLYAQMY